MNNKIFLNGPINFIKLINKKTDQEIWLFMDMHLNINTQTKCDEYDSKDIDKYIVIGIVAEI